MKVEEKIAGLCLYGFIKSESTAKQKRCLEEIERSYGPSIARIVRRHLRKR